jgi:hypothetical protein
MHARTRTRTPACTHALGAWPPIAAEARGRTAGGEALRGKRVVPTDVLLIDTLGPGAGLRTG